MTDAKRTVCHPCPVCDDEVEFPAWDHERAGDGPCAFSACTCVGEDEESKCPGCGARVIWHCDGEEGWPFVDEDDPAWGRKEKS